MPWHEVSPLSSVSSSFKTLCAGIAPITELCHAYDISRKTGYKFLARYDTLGRPASRISLGVPSVLQPRSILCCPAPARPHRVTPTGAPASCSASCVNAGPTRPGLYAAPSPVVSNTPAGHRASRVRRPGHAGPPHAPMDAPNVVWTADFKGQFHLGDGSLCFPLTIADGYSRSSSPVTLSPALSSSRFTPSSCASSTSTAYPRASAPIMASPLLRKPSGASPRSPSGGSASAFSPISSNPPFPIRTAGTNACISPSNANALARHVTVAPLQQRRFDRCRHEFNALRPHEALKTPPPLPATRPRLGPILSTYHRSSIPATTSPPRQL